MAFTCTECGATTPKWMGKCPKCHSWGTLQETVAPAATTKTAAKIATGHRATPMTKINPQTASAITTGISELDRVLGGGLVPGAVILLAGEPGVGKSTLLLDVSSKAAQAGRTVLYVTGEESAGQVRLRAERTGAVHPTLLLAAETDLATVLGLIDVENPALLIIDSVQTVASDKVEGVPGGVTQVREVASAIIRAAKARNLPTVLVGHITKDGTVAGPRLLEHLVDVVCSFEGDKHTRLRMLRAVKNRFGPTDEVGCFTMTEAGIESEPDPSGLFLSRSQQQAPGTCLTVTVDGKRPLVIEVQALTVEAAAGSPRRTVSGMDSNRVAMIIAVVSKLMNLSRQDVFVSTVGGAKIQEPAADLAVALALASAAANRPHYSRLTAIGELSLSGEIRRVPNVGQRLAEAARMGIDTAVVASGALDGVRVPAGIRVREVGTIAEAVALTMP